MSGTVDILESMLLLLLDEATPAEKDVSVVKSMYSGRSGVMTGFSTNITALFGVEDFMAPTCAHVFPPEEDDRGYAPSAEYLMAHPKEVIGDSAECALTPGAGSDLFRWIGLRRISKPPKFAVAAGKVDAWYEVATRDGDWSGWLKAQRGLIALSASGRSLPIKYRSYDWACIENCGMNAIVLASVIEDSYRAGTVLASVRCGPEVRIPVCESIYKAEFRPREGYRNTPTGRLNPIIHEVAEHSRRLSSGAEVVVKGHERGAKEIVIDGMTLTLTRNSGYQVGVDKAV